jgi:Acetyltransferase (GNAT) domain
MTTTYDLKSLRLRAEFLSGSAGRGTDCDWNTRRANTAVHVGYLAATRHAQGLMLKLVSDQGAISGVAGAVLARGRLRGMLGPTVLSLQSHPSVCDNDPALLGEFFRQIETQAAVYGVDVLNVQSVESSESPADLLAALGFQTEERFEYLLDLTAAESVLSSRLASAKKRNLKKAQRLGVQVREGSSLADLELLEQCQTESMERRGLEAGVSEFRRALLHESFLSTGLGRLFLAEREGRILSAMLIYVYRGRAFYSVGGSTPEGFECSSPVHLMWEIALRLRAAGCQSFNLGGTPAEAELESSDQHGLFRFKRDFGAEIQRCVSGKKFLRPVRRRWHKLVRRLVGRGA